jgi:hypothetical protein
MMVARTARGAALQQQLPHTHLPHVETREVELLALLANHQAPVLHLVKGEQMVGTFVKVLLGSSPSTPHSSAP